MLAILHASNVIKKAEKIRAVQTETPRFNRRRVLRAKPRRARGSIESADDERSSESDSRSPDGLRPGSPYGLRPGSSDGFRPGEARRDAEIGVAWGIAGWQLAEIANSSGAIIGCGAICGDHHDDAEDTRTCKKQVTIWRSGLTTRDLMLRLKRWLIAGLDDSHWDEEGRRSMHVSLGGRFLHDFCRRVVSRGLRQDSKQRGATGVMIACGLWPGRCCSSLRLPSLDSRY